MLPQGPQIAELAKSSFRSKGIKLPMRWQQPGGDAGKNYVNAFKPEERHANPDPQRLFVPVSTNKLHVNTANSISRIFERYYDGISRAIATAWSQWMTAAAFSGVLVNGPVGTVMSGNVVGPPMMGLIMAANPPIGNLLEARFSRAVAQAMNTAWQAWSVGLAGSLNYPPCAFFPAPVVPPLPNVAAPVASLTSSGESMMTKGQLSNLMQRYFGGGGFHTGDMFDGLADAIDQTFTQWKPATQVVNVMVAGAVPTFAPPLSPGGPIVGGVATGSGCFV